jgi:TrkA domain protein
MGKGVHIQELPGLGTRYDVDIRAGGERVSIVVSRDGKRHLYVFTSGGSDEPAAVIEMTEDQARKVGAVLAGTFFVD